jgi:hypothetical protein
MDSIEVDVDGLSALGGLCQRAAESLKTGSSAAHSGPPHQATARAVDDVLASASTAETLIGVRLRVTGHTIAAAADRLANSELASQAQIAAMPTGLTVF